VKQLGRELGVRYVSRKAACGGSAKISPSTPQLISTETGAHVLGPTGSTANATVWANCKWSSSLASPISLKRRIDKGLRGLRALRERPKKIPGRSI